MTLETTLTKETLVLVEAGRADLCPSIESVTLVTEIGMGIRGKQGIPGPAGGSVLLRTAGTTLSALLVVYEWEGKVYTADSMDGSSIDLLLGITTTAADEDEELYVQRMGELDDDSWNWAPGRVYLGLGGRLTQTPPASGFYVLVGQAVAATRLILSLQDPIELE